MRLWNVNVLTFFLEKRASMCVADGFFFVCFFFSSQCYMKLLVYQVDGVKEGEKPQEEKT